MYRSVHNEGPHPMTPRVALITGASSGIGQAIAQRLTSDGFQVFGTARQPDTSVARPFALIPLDVRSVESVRQSVATVINTAGRIYPLVNTAGQAQSPVVQEADLGHATAELPHNL